ncbi:MAG: CcmD family protein [Bacteroidetes Order II. Incertae sedis bacterium]|nr:CcmD family protein [Bacteroidetes Order II. bacterium]
MLYLFSLLNLLQGQQPKWSDPNGVPTAQPTGYEAVMVSDDKIWVVLAVVLIIWIGILFYLFRTDQKISTLERALQEAKHEQTL